MWFFRGSEIGKAYCLVDGIYSRDFPFAFGELGKLLAIEVVQMQMAIPAALAGPQRALAILEKKKIVAVVDPIGIIFTEGNTRLAGSRVCNEEIQVRLRAIEALNSKLL